MFIKSPQFLIEPDASGGRLPPPMKNDYSEFVAEAAEHIRELAERAPDIGVELRRFADELDRIVAIPEGRSDEAAA